MIPGVIAPGRPDAIAVNPIWQSQRLTKCISTALREPADQWNALSPQEQQDLLDAELERLLPAERLRVKPKFNALRYGLPTYCQLANSCAQEIREGADDESEMGVFHDLFETTAPSRPRRST